MNIVDHTKIPITKVVHADHVETLGLITSRSPVIAMKIDKRGKLGTSDRANGGDTIGS